MTNKQIAITHTGIESHSYVFQIENNSECAYLVSWDKDTGAKEWTRKIFFISVAQKGEKLIFKTTEGEYTPSIEQSINLLTSYIIGKEVAYPNKSTDTFYCQLPLCSRNLLTEAVYCTQYDCPHRDKEDEEE